MSTATASATTTPLASPTRTHAPSREQRESESENTAYSIDFDALLGDEKDDLDLTEELPLDVVRSEDVDGPSDFTQNMEFWMRTKLPPDEAGKQQEDRGPDAGKQQQAYVQRVDSGADARERVSDSEDDAQGSEHGSYGSGRGADGDTQAAVIRDLDGYVISDEDTFSPASRQGSIDEQMDILTSMDDVNEDDYGSSTASPLPREDWKPTTPAPKTPWLQPTVEDHTDTPQSLRPSPIAPRGKTPELLVEDYEELVRRPGLNSRPSPILSRDNSGRQASPLSGRPNPSRNESGQHAQGLLAQIKKLTSELERQREEFTSRIASLENHLQRTRSDLAGARENEQRRVRDLTAQHKDHVKDLEDHWQRRLSTAQERYEQDVQEQKASFALVKSSFESRLSGTESGLQAQVAQKEAEIEVQKRAHRQELEQQRVGHEAKVASLEERVNVLQNQLSERTNAPHKQKPASRTSVVEQKLARQKAESGARIAELEARLSTTQSHLETSRAESLAKGQDSSRGFSERAQTEETLAKSKAQVSDLESSLSVFQAQLAHARREIEDLRRGEGNAREGARVLREELEESQALVAEKTRRLDVVREELDEEKMKTVARNDAARMLENARAELEDERRRAGKRIEELEERLEGMQEEQEEKIDGMRKRAEEVVRRAGTMLNGERIEKASLKQALKAVKTEVDELRQELQSRKEKLSEPEPGSDNSDELEILREALREQTIAAKSARVEAQTAKGEAKTLRDDYDSINKAMDERIVQLMRAREKEWQQRYDVLLQERKAMGRALLHEWGREECGEQDPQEYMYKYVRR